MYGAIIGDTVGSVYEFQNVKSRDFPLFRSESTFTDDTIMTVAVAAALLENRKKGAPLEEALVEQMQKLGRLYPHPMGAYGYRFSCWLRSPDPKPYGSYGNGAAMRVSPCGILADSLEEALTLAETSAKVTHDHPEGIKGAQAVAAAIYLARTGASKAQITGLLRSRFYPMDRSLEEIRKDYHFDERCQGTVPQALQAFLEAQTFEEAIRNAMWLGGDSDTIGAITGAVAWAYFGAKGIQPDMAAMKAKICLPADLQQVVEEFEALAMSRARIPSSAGQKENSGI